MILFEICFEITQYLLFTYNSEKYTLTMVDKATMDL